MQIGIARLIMSHLVSGNSKALMFLQRQLQMPSAKEMANLALSKLPKSEQKSVFKALENKMKPYVTDPTTPLNRKLASLRDNPNIAENMRISAQEIAKKHKPRGNKGRAGIDRWRKLREDEIFYSRWKMQFLDNAKDIAKEKENISRLEDLLKISDAKLSRLV